MDAAVVARDLRKSYGDTVALDGASLSVDRGEVFALIGPNGAGKTTLVRALAGTTDPDGGAVSLFGDAPAAVDRGRLGVLPQDFAPPARLTARELLAYYAGLYDEARDPDRVLEAVGLEDAGDTRYEDLSGGQQRRVCVGSALVNDPDLCVLDEPTTGIDPAGRRTVRRLIEDLAGAGTTVFLTTHDMAEAERIADRVGLLHDGGLVAVGTPDALVRAHGGPSRLEVGLEAGAEDGGDRAPGPAADAVDALSHLEHDVDVRSRDGALVVRDVSPADIGAVVAALEERGVEYQELTWTEADLEDVYLELAEGAETGRPRPGNREQAADRAAGDAGPQAEAGARGGGR